MNDNIGAILIGIGVIFDVLGCLGLVRLPDVYNRLQAATKCVTLGTCLILIGVVVSAGWDAEPLMIKSLLCAFFIMLTSPVGAHALARGAYRSGVKMCDASVVDDYAGSEALEQYNKEVTLKSQPAAIQEQQHA
ncbi:MAG: Na+/H+ antiporter subunit G [Planctomycetota bacterium]|nr:MAG: Na+/H+ antiporter subunit G [Planctomycetota bacterium]